MGIRLGIRFSPLTFQVRLDGVVVRMTNGPAATIGENLLIDRLRRDRIEMTKIPACGHKRHEVPHFLHRRHSNTLDRAA